MGLPPRIQIRCANALMAIGSMPLAFTVCWSILFFLTTERGAPPRVPILDPIGMIGLLTTCFLVALLLGGAGLAWSWLVTWAWPEQRPATIRFRMFTALALASPLLLSAVAYLSALWTLATSAP